MTKTQKTAIITGASKGIGAAIAHRLAQDGHAVVVNYSSDESAANKVVDAIRKGKGRALAVRGDVSDPACLKMLFDSAETEFGSVNVLVNNAGIMRNSPISATSDADFETQCAINIAGTFRGMREAANRLTDGGRIISLSSSVVGLSQPSYGVYAATKAAIEAMSRILAKELGARAITVNTVAPGPVATDLFLAEKPAAVIEVIKSSNPYGRLGTPEDIAAVVAFLAGPEAAWINGQTLRANGGIV